MPEANDIALWQEAPCGFLHTDPSGVLQRVNRTWCGWVGVADPSAVIGRHLAEFLTPGSRLYWQTMLLPRLHVGGEVREVALEIAGPESNPLPVFLTARSAQASPSTGLSLVLIDASERRRYERDLLDATRRLHHSLDQRQRLLGVVAHDLRSPLAGMLGLLEVLSWNAPDADAQENTQLARQTGKQMMRLIGDLLDATAAESGTLRMVKKPGDLVAALGQAVLESTPLAKAKGTTLNWNPPAAPLPCTHDAQRLTQVMANLLSNAVKFSPPSSVVSLRAWTDGTSIRLEVADRGPGIPEGEVERLFQPFARGTAQPTAGESSTGLGLAIVREVVVAHGGQVTIRPHLGGGSIFAVELPQLAAPA